MKKVSGVAVVDGSITQIGRSTPVTMRFEESRLVTIEGGNEAARLSALLASLDDPNAYEFAAWGIGTNPGAALIGEDPSFEGERVYGWTHVSTRSSAPLPGGTVKLKIHLDGIIGAPTIYLDEELILEKGKFVADFSACERKHGFLPEAGTESIRVGPLSTLDSVRRHCSRCGRSWAMRRFSKAHIWPAGVEPRNPQRYPRSITSARFPLSPRSPIRSARKAGSGSTPTSSSTSSKEFEIFVPRAEIGVDVARELRGAVGMMYVRYPLWLRNVEDLLAERGIDISRETVRFWWNRFGPMFAGRGIRKRRVAHMHGYPQWRWHLDEVFVKVNGKLCYLWRAVDHEGEVFGIGGHCEAGQSCGAEASQEDHEEVRPTAEDGDRRASRFFAARRRSATPIARRSAAGSTIAPRIRISRFDDESGPCSAFEASRRCRNSALFMPRSTTISITSAI